MYKVNTSMENKNKQESVDQKTAKRAPSKPNEKAGFAVMGHVKIFDPNTKETILETRE